MPIFGGGGGVVSGAQIVDDSIADADINSAAAITFTKIAFTTKTGNATRLMSASSGAVTYAHGLGRAPKLVQVRADCSFGAGAHAFSTGAYDGTNQKCTYRDSNDAASSAAQTSTYSVSIKTAGGNEQNGVITVDATNITITWTKVGAGTETIFLTWIVM